jgi:hypothetical protein
LVWKKASNHGGFFDRVAAILCVATFLYNNENIWFGTKADQYGGFFFPTVPRVIPFPDNGQVQGEVGGRQEGGQAQRGHSQRQD